MSVFFSVTTEKGEREGEREREREREREIDREREREREIEIEIERERELVYMDSVHMKLLVCCLFLHGNSFKCGTQPKHGNNVI